MIEYKPQDFKFPKLKSPKWKLPKAYQSKTFRILILSILFSSIFGFLAGAISGSYFYIEMRDYLSQFDIGSSFLEATIEREEKGEKEYLSPTTQEETIIEVVKEVSPAVVSIIVTKDLPILETYYYEPLEEFEEFFGEPFEFKIPQYRQKGVKKQEIGGGTGFIVSEEGMIVTNKHVVIDEEADYTVLTNNGNKLPAKVLAKDPFQDLAILKTERGGPFSVVKLGDSEKLQIGQTVIAIGNALGEFQNTVSVGVISGLSRTITASGRGIIETLEDVIQTDAAINKGNSGGPLLNLRGEVVGINTAVSLEGENIGFAIPANKAERDIEQVKTLGKIVYPFLGIRYVIITDQIQEENNLSVNYGALIVQGDSPDETAIFPGSPAERAGLKEGDIILEFNEQVINSENPLAEIIMKYEPGDQVILKVLSGGKEKNIQLFLAERSE